MGKVTFQLDAEEAAAVRGFLKVEDRTKALEQRQKKLEQTTARRSRTAQQGLRSEMRMLGKAALGYLSISTAISGARRALQELNEERRRAADQVKQNLDPAMKLAQMSGGDPAAYQKMLAEARKTERLGYTQARSQELQFELQSAGVAHMREYFAKFKGIIDPIETVRGARRVGQAFKGEAGTVPEIVNKMFAASATTQTTMEQLAENMPKFASQWRMAGGGDEGGLAALAVLSRQMVPELAQTRLQAFSKKLLGTQYEGMSPIAAAEAIGKRDLSTTELQKMFGDVRAMSGYKLLQENIPDVRTTLAAIREAEATTGTERDVGRLIQEVPYSVPEIKAARELEKEKAKGDQAARDKFAVRELQSQRILEQQLIERMDRSAGPRIRSRLLLKAVQYATGDPDVQRAVGAFERGAHEDPWTEHLPGGLQATTPVMAFDTVARLASGIGELVQEMRRNTEATERANGGRMGRGLPPAQGRD